MLMKLRYLLLLSLLSFYNAFGQESFPINGVADTYKPIYAFTNAHIVLSPTTEITNGTLLIQGDKILAADSNITIPNNAIIKDLDGDYIYPSFIDLYTNYGLPAVQRGKYNYRPQYNSNKAGAYHWNESIHPEIKASNEYSGNKKDAEAFIKNGFGAVLTHNQDGIFRGTGCLTLLSEGNSQENILIADAGSFYSFNKGVSHQKYPSSLMGSIALIRQTLLDAAWISQSKDHTNLSLSAYNNQVDLPQFFSVQNILDYQRVFKIADEFEIDYIIKGNGKEYSRIEEVKSTEFPVIIPLNFPKSYDISNPEATEWISLAKLKDWESSPFNPAILAHHEVEFCITSSDLDKASDFLKNLKLAIKKGLKKEDALAALTTTPAGLINASNILGTI